MGLCESIVGCIHQNGWVVVDTVSGAGVHNADGDIVAVRPDA